MGKFDEILNSSDASDALLGEQIDKINESIGNYDITSLTPVSDVELVCGGYTKIGKLVVLNIRFTVGTTRAGKSTAIISTGVPMPKNVAESTRAYVAASVVDIQSDAHADTYGYIGRDGQVIVNVPLANHSYAISATYICE